MILKIISLAVIATFAAEILKKEKQDFAFFILFLASVLILIYVLPSIADTIRLIEDLTTKTNIDKVYIQIILKIVGICYLASFAADICKDVGENMLANKIIFAGKITIISFALPILKALIETVIDIQ